MSKLRDLARGQDCKIRLPGCDGGGSTTVLAHFRLLPYCGTGIKPSDMAFGAWSCYHCHELIDGRKGELTDEVRFAHALGCLRTIAELEKRGYIKAGKV